MSTLQTNTIQTSNGGPVTLTKQSAAKAWVNFNSTGTLTIRSSLNTSSITDNGTGDYTENFTNSMSDADYVPQGAGQNSANTALGLIFNPYILAASNFRMTFINEVAAKRDGAQTNITSHGDLA